MSIVLSYWCDQFAMIATDTMITAPWGNYHADKLYEVSVLPFGYCAGAGLEDGIFMVRDRINAIEVPSFLALQNAVSEVEHSIANTPCRDDSHTVFSMSSFDLERLSNNNRIFHVDIEAKENRCTIRLLDSGKFVLFAPCEFCEDEKKKDELSWLLPENYSYDHDAVRFLMRIARYFQYFSTEYPSSVSPICEIGFLYGDIKSKRNSIKIDAMKLISLLKTVSDTDNLILELSQYVYSFSDEAKT